MNIGTNSATHVGLKRVERRKVENKAPVNHQHGRADEEQYHRTYGISARTSMPVASRLDLSIACETPLNHCIILTQRPPTLPHTISTAMAALSLHTAQPQEKKGDTRIGAVSQRHGSFWCPPGARVSMPSYRRGARGDQLWPGGLFPYAVPRLRPRHGASHRRLLLRGEGARWRRTDHAGPADHVQLPQEIHGRNPGPSARSHLRDPEEVRRQCPLQHQPLHRLLSASI
ncbi:hypothetical protein B296_00047316 [Ensete ventricosum]|uniref:Uncharacterized protein n=1 Tax=Ensete ventricosum TaxID=4639 RepID=A0A426XCQ3_ENSVE|nr:hypothetical protein B296_00047316 [Ensete ventricosum]